MESLYSALSTATGVVWGEFSAFFGVDKLAELLQSSDPGQLLSVDGVVALAAPLIPVLLLGEMLTLALRGRFHWRYFRLNLFMLIVNGAVLGALSLSVAIAVADYARPYALIQTEVTWYWFIYGYIVWEFSHFVYHWLAHKVRLLWCLHSTHHAPPHMNLSVSYAHFFLEAPYADLVRVGICTLMGLDPVLLLLIAVIDSVWGSFIHVGEEALPDGRMGVLQKYILTPSHHRLHHAKNDVYIDTNFCNLLNIWDRVFGTYKEQEDEVPPQYGIKRPMNTDSFLDMYVGEFVALARDVASAPRMMDKLRYLLLPPHWRPEE